MQSSGRQRILTWFCLASSITEMILPVLFRQSIGIWFTVAPPIFTWPGGREAERCVILLFNLNFLNNVQFFTGFKSGILLGFFLAVAVAGVHLLSANKNLGGKLFVKFAFLYT